MLVTFITGVVIKVYKINLRPSRVEEGLSNRKWFICYAHKLLLVEANFVTREENKIICFENIKTKDKLNKMNIEEKEKPILNKPALTFGINYYLIFRFKGGSSHKEAYQFLAVPMLCG